MTLEIAARLTQLRKEKGLSQEDLAASLGVSRQAVSKWERGESAPELENLMALAELYGCTLDHLVHPGEAAANDGASAEQTGDPGAKAENAGPDPALPHGSFYDWPRFRQDFPYPLLVTVSYLALGFLFGLWHPGWILFLTIPLYYLPDSERGYVRLLGNPVMVTIIYLLLGVYCNLWHPGWLIFLAIPLLNRFSRR